MAVHNFKDLTGKQFGHLTVVSKYDVKNGKVRWLCRCDCGKETKVATCNLNNGHISSCGHTRSLSQSKDITGKRFGRLVAMKLVDFKNGARWLCKCDCGETKIVTLKNLESGNTKSCGCYNLECLSARATHGDSETHLYKEWTRIKDRVDHRTDYISKNITMCEEWRNNYETFKEWALSHGYDKDLSVDRINNAKGYSPDNCRWADSTTQNRNKDNNILLTYKGETHVISEWAEILNVNYGTFYSRIRRGWSIEKAIEKPLRKRA